MPANVLYYVHNLFEEPGQIGGVETCMLAVVKNLNRERFRPIVLVHGGGFSSKS